MKNMEIIALSSDDKDHERIIKFLKFGMDYVKKNLKESKEILRNKEKTESILISDKKFKNEKLINVDEIVYSSFSKLENVLVDDVEFLFKFEKNPPVVAG